MIRRGLNQKNQIFQSANRTKAPASLEPSRRGGEKSSHRALPDFISRKIKNSTGCSFNLKYALANLLRPQHALKSIAWLQLIHSPQRCYASFVNYLIFLHFELSKRILMHNPGLRFKRQNFKLQGPIKSISIYGILAVAKFHLVCAQDFKSIKNKRIKLEERWKIHRCSKCSILKFNPQNSTLQLFSLRAFVAI